MKRVGGRERKASCSGRTDRHTTCGERWGRGRTAIYGRCTIVSAGVRQAVTQTGRAYGGGMCYEWVPAVEGEGGGEGSGSVGGVQREEGC